MNKHLVFENLSDYWDYAFRESDSREKSSRNSSSSWYGNLSWAQSKQLAQNGWVEGMKKIEKIQASLSPLLTNKIAQATQEYALCGGRIDIGSYLANDPECFIIHPNVEKELEGKIITIVCSISFSSSISAAVIIQRGAIICALVDAIEYAGYRVELICNWAVSNSSIYRTYETEEQDWFEVDVTLKKSNQPLQMVELAFCLAHPSMLRRMMFSIAELEGWADYAYCYGCPAIATNRGALYLQELFSKEVSNDEAINWLLEELQKLGIEITTNN
jgi:hypothetical protein